jgi:hypothetical protein
MDEELSFAAALRRDELFFGAARVVLTRELLPGIVSSRELDGVLECFAPERPVNVG